MPIAPLAPVPVVLAVGADRVPAIRWQGEPGFAVMLLLPGRPGQSAGYHAYAAVVADNGVTVIVPDAHLEPGPAGIELAAGLLARLREEVADRPVVLAGHGVGGSLVADYLNADVPPPDAAVLIAPAGPRSAETPGPNGLPPVATPSLLERVFGRGGRHGGDGSAGGSSTQLGIAARVPLGRLPVRMEIGSRDEPRDSQRQSELLRTWPIGDWNVWPGLGGDLPNEAGWDKRAAAVADWLGRRLEERRPGLRPTIPDPARQPRAEAVAEHEAYVASEGARLVAFRDRVARHGGPAPATTAEGLEALERLLFEVVAEGPADRDPPGWHREAWVGRMRRISSEALWLIDGTVAFLLASARAMEPRLRWELCVDKRDAYYHRSLLQPLHVDPVSFSHSLLRDFLAGDPQARPIVRVWDGLRTRVAGIREAPAEQDDILPLDEVDVTPHDGPGWNAQVWIPEGAEPALGRARYEALASQIRRLPGVRDLGWEDREVMLLRLDSNVDHRRLRTKVVAVIRRAKEAAAAEGAADD